MAKRHKYAGASAVIETSLDAKTIASSCEDAAKKAETLKVLIRLEEAKPGLLVFSCRNRIVGGFVEPMTFEVHMEGKGDRKKVRTAIRSYKQTRGWILVIPLPWQMSAWSNYKHFMYNLVQAVKAKDPKATDRVVEIAHGVGRWAS